VKERRKLKRRHLIFYLRVFNNETEELIGYVVDITPKGIMVISDKAMAINKTYLFRMDLPTEIGESRHLHFKVKSAWCSNDVNNDFWDTGFQLIDVSPTDIKIIENLIGKFGFQD
jgi:hypothetical protein